MGIKRYIIVTLIYMLAIGLYVYSFNGESFTLELFGLSLTLPVAFWMVVPVLLLAELYDTMLATGKGRIIDSHFNIRLLRKKYLNL
jgi:uncharacterized membrane protein